MAGIYGYHRRTPALFAGYDDYSFPKVMGVAARRQQASLDELTQVSVSSEIAQTTPRQRQLNWGIHSEGQVICNL